MFIALLCFLEVYTLRNGADCPLVCLLGTFPAMAGRIIFAQPPVRAQPTNWPGALTFVRHTRISMLRRVSSRGILWNRVTFLGASVMRNVFPLLLVLLALPSAQS